MDRHVHTPKGRLARGLLAGLLTFGLLAGCGVAQGSGGSSQQAPSTSASTGENTASGDAQGASAAGSASESSQSTPRESVAFGAAQSAPATGSASESSGSRPEESTPVSSEAGPVSSVKGEEDAPASQLEGENSQTGEENEMKMKVQAGSGSFLATLEKNAAVDALVEMMREGPVTIQMHDYSGFEKVGPLGTSLPASDSQTTTRPGDIVLYTGNQIVVFYGSNSWSYTRLGKIDDLTDWEEALGSGDVTLTLSLD